MPSLIPDTDTGVSQDTVDRVVRGYVAAGSGLPAERVIPANAAGPAPVEAYSAVLLISSEREGRGWVTYATGATITARTVASIAARYQVQFYRDGAHELATRFRQWTESPGGIMYAQQHGIVYAACTEAVEVDSVISDEWEERASIELTIGHYRTLVQDVGIINSVPFKVNEAPEEIVQ